MSKSTKLKVRIQGFKYKSYTKVFPLQQNAFDFIDGNDEQRSTLMKDEEGDVHRKTESCTESLLFSLEPRLFAFEYNDKGKRRYVVSHLGRFMQEYWMEMKPSERNYYELIREETPCRLYFDLEYNKKANPNITDTDNETLLDEFITELNDELQKVYNIAIDRTNIVDLDSSTEKKFSRHFIIHMPNGELFADAPSCGIFVKNLIGRLAEEVATGEMAKKCPTLAKYLFVQNKPNAALDENEKENNHLNGTPKVCFVDTGVYTRNRVFRILGSVKFGKSSSASLRIAPTNLFPFPNNFKNEMFYNPDGHDNDPKYKWEDSFQDEESFWDTQALALCDTFVVPLLKHISKSKILPEIEAKSGVLNKENVIKLHGTGHPTHRSRKSNFGSSPFPELDDFVNRKLATRHGFNGSIRSWSLEDNQITYFMKDNRWCENIQRSHKSNNIMWNVSIVEGLYWQTCLDQECKFRGAAKELPSSVKKSLSEHLLDEAINVDEDFEKALLELEIDGMNTVDNDGQIDKDDGEIKGSSLDKVDDGFNEALLNLTLSDTQKLDEGIQNQHQNTRQGKEKSQLSQTNDDNSSEIERKRQDAEESFDSEFATALMKELTINPSFC